VHPRPSIRVEEEAQSPPGTGARTTVVLALVLTSLAGCGGGGGDPPDASARLDASIVETGLEFEDAGPAAADALMLDAVPSRDGGLVLCQGSCNPVYGTGCEPGQICALRDEVASCVAPTSGARGAACTTTEACGTGLACFRTARGAVGVCDRVCCPGGTDCAAPEVCGGDGALVDGTVSSWGRCLAPRTCTLLEVTSCPDREACYVVGSEGQTECLVAGTAIEGDACAAPNDCAVGLVCAGAFGRACARLCRLGLMEDPCGAGAMCVRQAYTPESIGVCVASSAARP